MTASNVLHLTQVCTSYIETQKYVLLPKGEKKTQQPTREWKMASHPNLNVMRWDGTQTLRNTNQHSSSSQTSFLELPAPLLWQDWGLEAELWPDQPHTNSQGLQRQRFPPTPTRKPSGIHTSWQPGILGVVEVLGNNRTLSTYNFIHWAFLKNVEACHGHQRRACKSRSRLCNNDIAHYSVIQ